jgi:toxin HigB-1
MEPPLYKGRGLLYGERAEVARRGKAIRRIPSDVRSVAVRKLDMVNAAQELKDLRVPPGNRLEALKGELKGRHSIRMNDQWRVTFRWENGDAHDVEIDDYH